MTRIVEVIAENDHQQWSVGAHVRNDLNALETAAFCAGLYMDPDYVRHINFSTNYMTTPVRPPAWVYIHGRYR